MESRIIFGNRLQNVRRYVGDTQHAMAEKLKMTVYSVRTWEQGKNYPSLETLADICRIYGVSADYLLGITESDPLFFGGKEQLTPKYTAMLHRYEQFLLEEQNRSMKSIL